MKILKAIRSGTFRTAKTSGAIFIFWFISLLLVSLIVLPVKADLKAAFGQSMITEKLADGINIDVFGDLRSVLNSMVSSLFIGFFLLLLVDIIVNIFLTGGLFNALKRNSDKFSSEVFFKASARNFWPFLLISVALYIIVLFLLVLIVIVPVSIASQSEGAPEGTGFKTLLLSGSLFLLVFSFISLVADYARAWQVCRLENAGFKAIVFGFLQTVRTFFSSYPLMIIMLVLQTMLFLGVMLLIEGFTPNTAGGLILLFIISQFLFLVKIFLKTLRYASVTSLMEQYSFSLTLQSGNSERADQESAQSDNQLKSETNV